MRDNTKSLPDSGEASISTVNSSVATQNSSILQFLSDTELVELPSKGLVYQDSSLSSGKVEIKYITLIQEDIISNKSYLSDGTMLTRLASSLLVDKTIKPETMLSADFMSIIYASRATAYGPLYDASVICPVCTHTNPVTVNMNDLTKSHALQSEKYDANYDLNANLINISLDYKGSKVDFVMRPQRYYDEIRVHNMQNKLTDKKNKKIVSFGQVDVLLPLVESIATNQSYSEDKNEIREFLSRIPSGLALDLKLAYKELQPRCANIIDISCEGCGHNVVQEVGVNADFFWPSKGS